jgi:long-chain fatty acid transport protein
MKKLVLSAATMIAVCSASAAGFGIYEASARGNALGGALVGSTRDVSAVYYNPANMTETTNVSFMVGSSFINPFCDVKVDGNVQPKMNSGWFVVPTFYTIVPLSEDWRFGLGGYSEFGLGTKYGNYWKLMDDTIETTIMQYTLNPNLSYKITDWWSIAGGIKMSYISFNNKSHPNAITLSELDGHDYTLGYNFATDFKILDNLSFGLVYRSRINHTIKGDFDLQGVTTYHHPASARLNLPQSITGGINWDVTKKLHLGFAATWTQWNSISDIHFNLGPIFTKTEPLNWRNAWRFGWSGEYDVNDDFAVRLGYVHDRDPSARYGTTMLPAGDRHIIGTGFGWYICENLRWDVGYNFIIMQSSTRTVKGQRFDCRNSFSHIISTSLTYTF